MFLFGRIYRYELHLFPGLHYTLERGVSARSEAPIGKCVVAPIVARAARGATEGDERAFGVDMARA